LLSYLNIKYIICLRSGEGGYEMINITYSGDMLYAYEVSHTQSRREIFRADLCPKYDQHGIREDALLPIELTPATSTAWGTASLERFHGVSSVVPCYSGIKSNGDLFHKFKNTFRGSGAFSKSGEGKEVKGQLIVIGDYISFLWTEQKTQIMFSRPSEKLALKILRETVSVE